MLNLTCMPAMQDVAKKLFLLRGAKVNLIITQLEDNERLHHFRAWSILTRQNFVYQIWPQKYSVPAFTYRARRGKIRLLPFRDLFMGRLPRNDNKITPKEQVITDILDQYESI